MQLPSRQQEEPALCRGCAAHLGEAATGIPAAGNLGWRWEVCPACPRGADRAVQCALHFILAGHWQQPRQPQPSSLCTNPAKLLPLLIAAPTSGSQSSSGNPGCCQGMEITFLRNMFEREPRCVLRKCKLCDPRGNIFIKIRNHRMGEGGKALPGAQFPPCH